MKWVTVSDMCNNAKVAEAKLLSTFNADFWAEYKNHSEYYDRLFGRMFGSFRFFDQQPKKFYEDISTADITQVRMDFTDAVYDHLLVNSKKYEELYRVSQLADANYPITSNYDVTETKEETISKEGEEVSGERTDTSSTTHGAYEDSVTSVHGARTDSKSDTLGQRTDEVTKAYAQHIDQTDETLGQRSDSHSVTQGAQSNSRETGIAGFNSSSYSDDANMSEQLGSRSDSSSDTIGQQINGKEITYGAHQDVDTTIHGSQSNSSSMTTGAQTDTVTDTKASRSVSGSDVKGEQTDTFEHSISDEYTLRKVGNIGVKTVSEMLGEHIDLWTSYEFYRYIFKEICADLLLI